MQAQQLKKRFVAAQKSRFKPKSYAVRKQECVFGVIKF